MSSREDILRALDADPDLRPDRDKAPVQTDAKPDFLAVDDWDTFAANLEAVGGRFTAVRNMDEAKRALAELLREIGPKTAVRWDHPVLESIDIDGALQEAGVELLTGPGVIEHAARADLGITSADALLAESGSLAVAAAPGQARSASLLPPLHLAVVGPGMMLADVTGLPSLLRRMADENGRQPSAVHLITGTSTTADIEETLVRGIHGPMAVYVLAVQSL